MNNDRDIVLKLQKGNIEALGTVFDKYRNIVYRTALAVTGDPEAANDLLQDVFLRLFRFADRIDPKRPIKPWLYRMTVNLSYTWIKKRKRWYHPIEDLANWIVGTNDKSPYEQAESRDSWRLIQKALANLPIQQRIVVVLYYLNSLSLKEISEILEIPVGTVKSRLHYGRRGLKKFISLEGDVVPEFNYE